MVLAEPYASSPELFAVITIPLLKVVVFDWMVPPLRIVALLLLVLPKAPLLDAITSLFTLNIPSVTVVVPPYELEPDKRNNNKTEQYINASAYYDENREYFKNIDKEDKEKD